MSRPTLKFTPFGTNTTKGKMSPIDWIPVREITPLTRPREYPTRTTDSSKRKGKGHVPADPYSDPSSSDSSSNESDLSNDNNYIKANRNKCNTKKTCQKHKKHDKLDSSSSDSYSSNNSDNKRK